MVFKAKLNWWNNHKSRQFFWTRTKGKLSKRANKRLDSEKLRFQLDERAVEWIASGSE